MIKKLKEEPEFVARSRFIPALTNFKDESVYNQLIESLRNDSKSDVRASAARALGQYGDTRAHDILLSITENINEDPLVRFYSARSLDKIDPDAYKVMKNIVQEEKNDIVKKELQRIIISKGKGR
jgi:HEAT repeat protein